MIRISVITCTYNAADVLQRTLDSVLQQVYPAVEHWIIDGASADDTVAMAQTYARRSAEEAAAHEVHVCSERDGGLYDAMNKGIEKATGDYLVYLNAGDVFPSADTLELVAGSVGEGETLPGVLYGDTDVVDAEGQFVRHRRLKAPESLSWRSFRQGMLVCHQAFYARTELARQHPYRLEYRYSADVDWCIRIMKAAGVQGLPIRNVHGVVANYLEGGMSVQHHRASLMERFQVMRSHYGLLPTLGMHLWFLLRSVFKR